MGSDTAKAGGLLAFILLVMGAIAGSTDPTSITDMENVSFTLPSNSSLLDSINNTIIGETRMVTEIPYTSFGGDYLVYYSDHAVSIWNTSGYLEKVESWALKGFSTIKLGFEFTSDADSGFSGLDYNKFDDVLDLMDGVGLTVIPCLQHSNTGSSWQNGYIGSAAMTTDWEAFVTYYLDDPRISAINIYGEPAESHYAAALNTVQLRANYYKTLIDALQVIDPDRVIVFPFGMFALNDAGTNYVNASQWITAVQASGVTSNSYVL